MGRMVFLLLAVLAAPPAAAEAVIGVPLPLTGGLGWTGELSQAGAEQAVADLNRAGGLLGQKVGFIPIDDACDAGQAQAAARVLLDRQVVAVIGHPCSGAAIPASGIYEAAGMLFIATRASNPLLTDRGHHLTFRTFGRDEKQGEMAVEFIEARFPGVPVGIVHDGELFGRELAGLVRDGLRRRGREPVLFEAVAPGSLDLSDLVARLKKVRVGVIYFGGYADPGGLLRRQTWAAGLQVPLVGSDGFVAEDFWIIAGPEAAPATLNTAPPDTRRRPEAAAVVARFREAGVEPHGPAMETYAAVEVWGQAVRRAGTTAPTAVAEVLRSQTFQTVRGEVGFDAKGDMVGPATWVWYGWRDGTYLPLEDLEPAVR
jgi:branched-chain amino acid transport system substrate-binding protein